MCDNIPAKKNPISIIKNREKNKSLHIDLKNDESNLQDDDLKTPSPYKLKNSSDSPEIKDKHFAFQSSRNYKSILENRNDPKGNHHFITKFQS